MAFACNGKGRICLIFFIFLMLFSNSSIANTNEQMDNCFLSSEYICIDNLDDIKLANNKMVNSIDDKTFEKSAVVNYVENLSYDGFIRNTTNLDNLNVRYSNEQDIQPIINEFYLSNENFSKDKNYSTVIINAPGKYYITEDIDTYTGICLNTSDVLIDGMGHILTSNRSNSTIANAGITNLVAVHNITVQNYHVVDNNAGCAIRYGIYDIKFVNCSTIDCNTGFLYQGARNMTFINCNVTGAVNYGFAGITTTLAYHENCYCNKDFNQAFMFLLVDDIIIKNTVIENSGAGVYAAYCENLTLENCTVLNNDWGTYILRTIDIIIDNYDVKNSSKGLFLIITKNVSIKNSKLCHNSINAHLAWMEDARIKNNSFSHGEYGLYSGIVKGDPDTHFKNITIVQNKFVNNSMYALSAGGTSQTNWVYLNDFNKNKKLVDSNFLKGNYLHSPIINYTYENKEYTGRLGNHYGKGCGKCSCGVYNHPKCTLCEIDL
ncbi:parallel beta-helix repeat protein [Methanococcus voltae]|uniref:NosD domain-containing protein n=1 Tax=Methanococcus voltae TaxID=2188 RepID=UPI001AE1B015|nr:NosD domain-containing protein [Methanococcus voltae]MBP2144017.1 parallel beta-helix repeat protein [Methanococcus voltae]